jgi:hypothetical protein
MKPVKRVLEEIPYNALLLNEPKSEKSEVSSKEFSFTLRLVTD